MAIFTSRQFNQDASGAKRASAKGPVFITDRGQLAHVLMTIEHYRQMSREADQQRTLGEMLAMDGDVVDAFDEALEEVREELRTEKPQPVDFD